MKAYLYGPFTGATRVEIVGQYRNFWTGQQMVIKSLSDGSAYRKGKQYHIRADSEFYTHCDHQSETLTGRVRDFSSVPTIDAPPLTVKDYPFTI